MNCVLQIALLHLALYKFDLICQAGAGVVLVNPEGGIQYICLLNFQNFSLSGIQEYSMLQFAIEIGLGIAGFH